METKLILNKTDHTILSQTATLADVRNVCAEAVEFSTASACIPPCYVKQMRKEFANLTLCTVIGFPNGYSTTLTKVFETVNAIGVGADEIDMVVNIADIKNANFNCVADEISGIKDICNKHILKVIVETCLLNDDEKIRMCEIVTKAGADFIKTSTGFSAAGAQLADIALFRRHIGAGVKIKASGGIRTLAQAAEFIAAGCDRIGASALVRCAKELR